MSGDASRPAPGSASGSPGGVADRPPVPASFLDAIQTILVAAGVLFLLSGVAFAVVGGGGFGGGPSMGGAPTANATQTPANDVTNAPATSTQGKTKGSERSETSGSGRSETSSATPTATPTTREPTTTASTTAEPTTTAPAAEAKPVYRINVGGPKIKALDGPEWSEDSKKHPSEFRISAGRDESKIGGPPDGERVSLGHDVPEGTPERLFQSTRYDKPEGTEMAWTFPVKEGQTYEVRVYFAETWLDRDNVAENGPREFAMIVEGEAVLDHYSIYRDVGHDVGTVQTVRVTPSDKTLSIQFIHQRENPTVAGIEIVRVNEDEKGPEKSLSSIDGGTVDDRASISLGTRTATLEPTLGEVR